jgi:hypothetical protein
VRFAECAAQGQPSHVCCGNLSDTAPTGQPVVKAILDRRQAFIRVDQVTFVTSMNRKLVRFYASCVNS